MTAPEGVYRFDPGLECADCGADSDALWLADVPGGDRYVCENCKEW